MKFIDDMADEAYNILKNNAENLFLIAFVAIGTYFLLPYVKYYSNKLSKELNYYGPHYRLIEKDMDILDGFTNSENSPASICPNSIVFDADIIEP